MNIVYSFVSSEDGSRLATLNEHKDVTYQDQVLSTVKRSDNSTVYHPDTFSLVWTSRESKQEC